MPWHRAARNQRDPHPGRCFSPDLVSTSTTSAEGSVKRCSKHFLVKALEVARLVGVRVVLVHAANESAAAWHQCSGFERSSIDDRTLMLLIDDISHNMPQHATTCHNM
jgi:hypothetical protein